MIDASMMSCGLTWRGGRAVALAAAVLMSACGGSGDAGGPTQTQPQPAKLVFLSQPADTLAGATLGSIRVGVADPSGNTVATATSAVTITLAPGATGAELTGTTTVNAVGGVAEFSDLRVDRIGTGYALVAASASLTSVTSNAFDIHVSAQVPTQLVLGYNHTCALAQGGVLYCWGNNGQGALGDGTRTSRSSPTVAAPGVTFSAVAAGGSHTCGIASTGDTECWGFNEYLELGAATASSFQLTPVIVNGGVKFAEIGAGVAHNCGRTAAGAAYCWGRDDTGELGDGLPENHIQTQAGATAVVGGLTFASLMVGGFQNCGITAVGKAYCWGADWINQLGDGAKVDQVSPVPVSGGLTFALMSAGPYITCGLTPAGVAYCWGYSPWGGLGVGDSIAHSTPTAVLGGLTFRTVSVGQEHACGIATSGATYCWGQNSHGEVGDGTTADRAAPVQVQGGLAIATVVAGGTHTCAITTDGKLYCWGANDMGQLGDGTTTVRLTPVAVGGLVQLSVR